MVSGSALFYILLIITLSLVGVYFLTMGKRRRPRIHSELLDWRSAHIKPNKDILHSVFLIGDAGAPMLSHPDPVLELLRKKLAEKGEKATVIFLGDNIYPLGLPDKDEPSRKFAEKRLKKQLDAVKDHPGKIHMISGNHDWRRGRKGGMKAVIRQEKFVEEYLNRSDVFLPSGALPGPIEIEAAPGVIILFINTVWFLYRSWRGKRSASSKKLDHDFFESFRSLIEKNVDKHVLVAAHHPLFSKSFHGGKFTLKQHLFPLTELGKKWYVPIPGAGSLYPLYRKYIGSVEDMAHPRYRRLKKQLLKIMAPYRNVLYAAGHDHNLQYIEEENHHFLVSGSGSKVTHVRGDKHALFTHAHKGFFEVTYFVDGSMWIGAWETGKKGDVLAFSRHLPREEAILLPAAADAGRESA